MQKDVKQVQGAFGQHSFLMEEQVRHGWGSLRTLIEGHGLTCNRARFNRYIQLYYMRWTRFEHQMRKIETKQRYSSLRRGSKRLSDRSHNEAALSRRRARLNNIMQGAFVEHINASLGDDAFLKEHGYLPISREGDGLCKAMSDGILLW